MPNATVLSSFAVSYMEAREKFLRACNERLLSVDSRINPNVKGAAGEDLFIDTVQIGEENAANTLLLLSGTHGVEGYCGSGIQVALLNNGYFNELPDDLSVLMVHAMNPYGFSHDRRVNEDNVDLNRNFLDFSQPVLPGQDYARVQEFVVPSDWDGVGREQADMQMALFIEKHGMKVLQAATSSGQYQYPDGVFYGGQKPTWSNTVFRSLLSDYLIDKRSVGTIDFHTGLGPHGYGELITIGSESEKARAAKWYNGDVTDPEAGTSTSADLDGMVAHGIAATLTQTELTFVTLEFGTFEVNQVLTAIRGDNWLYQKGDINAELGKTIKRAIRKAFYPDTDAWKLSVWERSHDVVQMTLDGLK